MELAETNSGCLLDIKSLPIFSSCSSGELVRLLPHVYEKTVSTGECLFKSGEKPESFFYILNGRIKLSCNGKDLQEIERGFVGEEAAIAASRYLGDAVASENTKVIVIPADSYLSYLGKNPAVGKAFYSSLFSHYSGDNLLFEEKKAETKKSSETVSKAEFVGWMSAILLPFLVWQFGGYWNLEIKARLFLMVFSSITIMWVFRLMAEFIPCILGVLALIILGVAPHKDVLQGFSSGEFFMAMSIFGVGAVLVSSGLTFRLVLLMLRHIPTSPFFHSFSMVLAGIFLTPILPSANGRIGLAGPIMVDMLEALDYKPGGKASTTIAIGTFTGFTLFASVFLTSKPINFVVYGLLPIQVQEQFQWLGWFTAAAVSGLVLLTLSTIFLAFYSSSGGEKSRLTTDQIEAQLKMLGSLSILEWTALVAVGIFIFGIALSSFHKVDPPWVALAILILLLALNALHKKEFHERVDWSFVLYLAGLIGLVKTMSAVGIDTLITQNLEFVGPLMRENFGLFVIVLFFSIAFIRLIVPNNATIAIFCTVLLPVAQANGINPWVVGYMILTFSDGWYAPYQCTYYLFFLQLTEKTGWYDSKAVLKFNILTNLFRLTAVFISIPYWKWMGII